MAYKTMPAAPMELKSMTAIARGFALPHETQPMRLPSFPALERTAVMTFNSTSTITVPSDNIGGTRGLLFRQATYPLWLETTTSSMGYGVLQYAESQYDTRLSDNGNYDEYIHGSFSGLFDGQTYQIVGLPPPAGYAIVGVDDVLGSRPFVYVPKNFMYSVTLSQTEFGSGNKLQALIERYTHPGASNMLPPIQMTHIGTIGLKTVYGFTATATEAMWIRVGGFATPGGGAPAETNPQLPCLLYVGSDLSVSVSGAALVVAPSGTKRALLPTLTTTALKYSSLPFENTRVTAAAVLFTNVTKVLNKEGTVAAARLNPEVTDVWNFSASGYDNIHPAEKYFYGLEKGFYTYSAPSTDLARFWDYAVDNTALTETVPAMRLDNNALVNSWLFSDPDGETSLAVNLDWHIEFRNTSQLWPVGLTAVTLESLHQAQLALVAAGFFFDNVDHKWILQKILSAAKALRPLLNWGFSASVQMGRGMKPAVRAQQPRPTTLQIRSGKTKGQKPKPKKPQPPQQKKKMASGLDLYLKSRKK